MTWETCYAACGRFARWHRQCKRLWRAPDASRLQFARHALYNLADFHGAHGRLQ
jgi:hypothetical protein